MNRRIIARDVCQYYRAPFICTLLMVVFISPVIAQPFEKLDETWTVTVAGQSVQVNPDGSFRIANVAAPDQFGAGGPGTRPDFFSDDFVRAFGVSTANGKTRYAFSEPFRFRQGETFIIGNMIITDTPPPFPVSIVFQNGALLVLVGETTQLTVVGTLEDGSTVDVTERTSLTVYRTSNPAIATVGQNGLVTGNAVGTAFLTAVNEGATAVKRLTVTTLVQTTTVEGFVQLEDGTPVTGANVTTPFNGDETTGAEGFFSFQIDVPSEESVVAVRATATVDGEGLVGSSGPVEIVPGGLTDAGVIELGEGVLHIFWTVNQGPGTSTFFFGNKIQRANPDGSGVIDLITGLSRPTGLAVAGGQLYWNDNNTKKTQRSNFDGSGVTTLFTGPFKGTQGLAVDLAASQVYSAEAENSGDRPDRITRTNFDGSGRTIISPPVGFPHGVALDLPNGHVYSTNAGSPLIGIHRSNLDGTSFTTILSLSTSDRPRGIALDLSAGHIYFTEGLFTVGGGSVRRVNFDGSGLVTLVPGLTFPSGIALDLLGGQMYWADIMRRVIQRADLDGSNVTTLVSGINNPQGIALETP